MGIIDELAVQDQVFTVIATVLGINKNKIFLEAALRSDLGADSLDLVAIIVEFGKIFDIQVCDAEVEMITTVGETVNYLLRKSLSFEPQKTISQYYHFMNLKENDHG